MGEWRVTRDRRRAAEFEAFVSGAAGRLLHVAGLLTAEPFGAEAPEPLAPLVPPEPLAPPEAGKAPQAPAGPSRTARDDVPAARELLHGALARTYAVWDSVRYEDPYDRARYELITRFSHTAWRFRHPHGGVLSPLSPHERVVLVLRLFEGVSEEQVAAMLGLPEERVRAVFDRAVHLIHPGTRPMEARG